MDQRTERSKMVAGEFYDPADAELTAARAAAAEMLVRCNQTPDDGERRLIQRFLLHRLGPGSTIRTGFACDYGFNIQIGPDGFVNFNCVFLDCAPIVIGARLQMGPAVQLYTPIHPLDAAARVTGKEYARTIRIGDDVWFGGGAIVLPGVTIGDRAVIGAGAVVNRDVPADVLVVGNPARVARRLNQPEAHA